MLGRNSSFFYWVSFIRFAVLSDELFYFIIIIIICFFLITVGFYYIVYETNANASLHVQGVYKVSVKKKTLFSRPLGS